MHTMYYLIVFTRLLAVATNSFNVLGVGLQIKGDHYSRSVFPLLASTSDTAPVG